MANLTEDMKKYYDQFVDMFKKIQQVDPNYAKAFMGLVKESEKEGALSTKVKELISVALAVAARCQFCIAIHVKNAIEAGATKQEILESAFVAGLMGGGPAFTYIKYVFDACEQFGAK
ncbi:MAG: carboxymuconolactone decarboxylase family protein [Synergistetes bacterium]|nr:carboxymuconolactone decarboxylase family protein [Synergistota bacterium]MCX8127477.1 carboxymuconolactone decarboxylase family protein [Synergistota bacterium]MDW8192746.1 carboxymuconolactone decarboxylase family protein [Synergistota bacterium]